MGTQHLQPSRKRVRRTAEDWQEAMLDALAEEGPAAVDIEHLSRRMAVTKGSFYWHYSSREALIGAAMTRWKQADAAIIAALLDDTDAACALRELFISAACTDRHHRILAALLQGVNSACGDQLLAQVSRARLQVLVRFFRRQGYACEAAAHRAGLAHTFCLGLLQPPLRQRLARLRPARRASFVDETVELLLPVMPLAVVAGRAGSVSRGATQRPAVVS